ncbi:MAG: polysaccharide pyruvyl transferase family protein [Anaerolineaceae bacterium]|nr:polysaccharide pyruvyl transferase family protein [Anaerolineaceae bacterium]
MQPDPGPARSSPTILLLNFHSLQNAGDAGLLEASLAGLRRVFQQPRILVSSNYPSEAGFSRLGVEAVPSIGALLGSFQMGKKVQGGWHKLWQAYQEADLVISCAGNPFFSMGRFGWPLLLSACSVGLALLFNRPLYILPQTLGPFNRKWEELLVRALYRPARLVFVREPVSLRTAERWNMRPGRLQLAPDLAFDLTPGSAEEAQAILRAAGCPAQRPRLAVVAIPRMVLTIPGGPLQASYALLGKVLGRLAAHYNLQLVFFGQSSGPTPREDDRLAARKIIACLPDPSIATLVEDELTPAQLMACYGQMDALLAGRMHSGIFALGMGKAVFFIGYLIKTAGLVEMLGKTGWMLSLEQLDEPSLWEKLSEVWEQRETSAALAPADLAKLKCQSRQPMQMIAEDYNYYRHA